jgi:hypothetical protein
VFKASVSIEDRLADIQQAASRKFGRGNSSQESCRACASSRSIPPISTIEAQGADDLNADDLNADEPLKPRSPASHEIMGENWPKWARPRVRRATLRG